MSDIEQEAMPPSTTPSDLKVVVRDFTNEEAAHLLEETMLSIIRTLGSYMDLSRLDGVTVGIDYDAALASIDRGMPGLRPLTRSDTAEMQGVAMSPAVLRGDEVRTHLVFNAEQLVPLIWGGEGVTDDDRAFSVGLVAHECAHVQVTAEKERAVPECRLGTRIEGYERAIMFQLAEICWDEYAVCRISAPFAAQQNVTHAQTVVACVEVAREQADDAIRTYRVHGDLDRLVAGAGPPLVAPMKAVAYLLGGMDGSAKEWSDFPGVRSALETASYDDLVDRLHSELRRLWDTRDRWEPTMAVFSELEAIAKAVFDSGGIHFRTEPDGSCHIDVPFTPWTIPI